ncbi:MAG: glycosyltransferase family 4 protein [Bacteroidia bacterium]|nr:glycosyltransferase family 4 protein [Bacteroidia bacterium]
MKILMVCIKPPFPAKDGASVVMKVSIQSLVEEGHDVSVILMSTQKHTMNESDIPTEFRGKVHFEIVQVNTAFTQWGLLKNYLFSRQPFHAERFNIPDFRKRLENLLQSRSFDIIQLDGLYMAEYLDTIRRHSKAKIVLRAHNLEQEIWYRMRANEKNLLKKIYLKSLADRHQEYEWGILNREELDGIVCLSARDARMMKEAGVSKPVIVAEYSIDVSEMGKKNPFPGEVKYPVFFIGSMDWTPNIEGVNWFLNEVWDRVRLRFPDLIFYIAGRNMPEGFAEGIRGVRVIGEVEDAHEFMASGGVMLAPLLTGGGIRIKIIEGMAMAKPVVATTLAMEGNPAKNGVEVLIADSPVAFAEGVILLLQNHDIARKMGVAAREFSLNYFNNKNITLKVLSFYHNLTNN